MVTTESTIPRSRVFIVGIRLPIATSGPEFFHLRCGKLSVSHGKPSHSADS